MLRVTKLSPRLNRRRDSIAVVVILAVTGALLAGCGGSTKSPDANTSGQASVLRVGTTFLPQNLNPMESTNSNQFTPSGTETLMNVTPKLGFAPSLAVSWKAVTPLHWQFTLRKGVKFWDGNEMTATDVAFSLNELRNPRALASRSLPPTIKDVKEVSRYQVDIFLSEPDSAFLARLAASGSIFEKAYYEQHKAKYGVPGNPVQVMGTGPYVPQSFDPTTGEELKAQEHYWGGKPRFKRVSIKFFQDVTSNALAFRAGEVDVSFPNDPAGWEKAAGSKGIIVDPFPSYLYWLIVNTRKAPWNDVHVRRAVAYALNQSELVDAYGKQFATPLQTFVASEWLEQLVPKADVDALMAPVPKYSFDLAKAKAELAQSAYPHGATATGFLFNGANLPLINQVIQAQLAKIGITYKPQTLPSVGEYAARLDGPKDKITSFVINGNTWIPDAGAFFHQHLGSWNLRTGAQDWSSYTQPEVDSLLRSAEKEYDPKKRAAIYGKILQIVNADVPHIPLFTSHQIMALSSRYTFKYPSLVHLWPDTPWLNYVVPKGES